MGFMVCLLGLVPLYLRFKCEISKFSISSIPLNLKDDHFSYFNLQTKTKTKGQFLKMAWIHIMTSLYLAPFQKAKSISKMNPLAKFSG